MDRYARLHVACASNPGILPPQHKPPECSGGWPLTTRIGGPPSILAGHSSLLATTDILSPSVTCQPPAVVLPRFFSPCRLAQGPLSLQHTLTGLAVAPVVALFEETLIRGYILESFLRLSRSGNVLPAVLWSSLLFGLSHLMNLARQDLPTTLYQVGFTFALGALYSAIYLRTGSLWWPIVLHFANDFIVLAGTGSAVQAAPNLFTIIFSTLEFFTGLATVFWLLRPNQRKDIATHFQL